MKTKPRTQMITSNEAKEFRVQHHAPCSDCPWARKALRGWLGPALLEADPAGYWLRIAHSHTLVGCHTRMCSPGSDPGWPWPSNEQPRWQCAGIAIYRRNVLQSVDKPGLILPANKVIVFASPMEFRQHHKRA